MMPDELLRNEAAKWLRQAAMDRNAAQVLLDVEPSRSVFLSQQAAEKAAKAFLTFARLRFGRPTTWRTWGRSAPPRTQAWSRFCARRKNSPIMRLRSGIRMRRTSRTPRKRPKR